MKYILISALVLFSCKGKENQKPHEKKDSLTTLKSDSTVVAQKEVDILKILLDEETKNEKPKEIDYKNYTASFRNEGDPYTVAFRKISSDDFNNDGLPDYIIERNSEGMLGGNANTNSEIFYIIMGKGNKISEKHEILGYAPFSYNVLDGITYEDGKLKATAEQNYRAYSKPMDSLESTDLSFVYKDGNVYEESYLTGCALAKWKDKKVFKASSEHHRSIDMHNYTETVAEKYVSNGFEASAELSGCDNLEVVLEGTYKTTDTSLKSIGEKKEQFLSFLVKNTVFQKELTTIQNYYHTHQVAEKDAYTNIGNLSFNIFTTKSKGQVIFRLVMIQENNPKQKENWEIVTRSK